MSKDYKAGQHVTRLVPCPDYDISSMENWLSDMAEKGLILEKDGFFAGTASFCYQAPRKVKYRLEAVQKKSGWLDPDNGEPDPEQVELSLQYSWEYVAKYGNFYIYCSEDPSARELNTDPQVQAFALNKVRKRLIGQVIDTLLLLVVYPLLLMRGCVVSAFLTLGSVWMIVSVLFLILLLCDEIRAVFQLLAVQKSLKKEGCYTSNKTWKQNATYYLARKIMFLLLSAFLIYSFLKTWGGSITNEGKVPLEEYSGELPFASILDFAGEGASNYKRTMSGLSENINTIVDEKENLIAVRFIEYNEHAQVKMADGNVLDGGLHVEYAEMKSQKLASILADELYRMDRWSRYRRELSPLEIPDYSMDFQLAYVDDLHFPTVIFRKGNKVIKAYFYQTSYQYTMPLEEWTRILAGSIS